MDEYQTLIDAYRILARLYSSAWAEPLEVPTQIAIMLLNARDRVGGRIHEYICPDGECAKNGSSVSTFKLAADSVENRKRQSKGIYAEGISGAGVETWWYRGSSIAGTGDARK